MDRHTFMFDCGMHMGYHDARRSVLKLQHMTGVMTGVMCCGYPGSAMVCFSGIGVCEVFERCL